MIDQVESNTHEIRSGNMSCNEHIVMGLFKKKTRIRYFT